MKNENRAAFDRTSEPYDLSLELPPLPNLIPSGCSQADQQLAASSAAGRLVMLLARIWRRRANRLALLELNDDQLKDIGISRSQAYGDYSRYRRSNPSEIERKFS